MIETTGDLWSYPSDAIVIPTNGDLTAGGKLVMGAGVALQAKQRYPGLPFYFGSLRSSFGNTVHVWENRERNIIAFPTKHHWKHKADLELITTSAVQLEIIVDRTNWEQVILPRVGCGLGGLDWEKVRPALEPFLDDRFIVLTPGGA